MLVHPQLDERAKRRAAEDAERTFGDAGKRAGTQFTGMFSNELSSKLDERALEKSVSRLEGRFARAGTTSAEKFNAALLAESARTGIAADKIGEELTKHLGVHGGAAGDAFVASLTNKLSYVAPMYANALSGVSTAAKSMGVDVSAAGLAAAGGIAAIGVGAVEVTKKLYDIGLTFDNVSKGIEIQTGKMGSDLEAITTSIDHVAVRTASSIEKIGGIGGSLAQQLHMSGQPLEELTKQVADLDRMTGDNLNIRDFGKVMRAFGTEDGPAASQALDELFGAFQRTGAPVNELLATLKNMGPAVRSLHLDFGQTAAIIEAFDEAGINADSTVKGLNRAIKEAADKGLDFKTVLGDAITQTKHFLEIGDEKDAQELSLKLFGTRGAQQFLDAIRQGKLTISEINDALKSTPGTIEDMSNKTLRFADTWTIVKNRIEEALKPFSQPVFKFLQDVFGGGSPDVPAVAPQSQQPIKPGPGGPGPGGSGALPSDIFGPPGGGGPGSGPPAMPAPPGPGGLPGAIFGPHTGSIDAGGPPLTPAPPTPGPDTGGGGLPTDDDDLLGALATGKKKKGSHTLPEAPEVPYGPGFGAPPRPGQTAESYGAEQRVLEERHTVEEDRARVNQLEHTNNVSQDDIQKAKNKQLHDEQTLNGAMLALYQEQNKMLTQHVDSMHELGAKLDNDFGISKGLAGIADNLTRFLGNLMMAGPLAAMQHMIDASGIKTLAPGAGGLIGMGAVTGAFGPGMMAGGGGIGYGAGYAGGGYGAPGPFGGFPGRPGALGGPGGGPAFAGGGVPAAGFNFGTPPVDEASIRAWAQQTFGIPDSMGTGSWTNASHVDDGLLHHTGQGGQKHVGSGYAFDFHGTPEQMDAMANWIATNMSAETLELIHQGPGFDPSRGIKNGRQSDFGPDLDAQHRDHVHWAPTTAPWDMAPGGPLQGPGATPGSDMATDASGAIVAPSGWSGGGGGHAGNWNAVAGPESGNNWGINSGNGYSGGLQIAPGTWKGYGGDQFAPNPFQATPEDQMTVGDRILATGWGGTPPQGKGAWPATSGAHPDWFGPGSGGGAPVTGGPGQGPTDLGGVAAPVGVGGGLPGGSAPGEASALGGVGAPAGSGAGAVAPMGGAAAGAGAGAASLGIGLAIQIAMQEAQRAIQYAGAVGGIAASGLMQTFLPTGGSQLAQNSWLTRIAGGLAGARPQVPNAAGKSTTQAGGAPPPPGGGGGQGGQGQGETKMMTHNGDVNINAPSGDGKDIAAAYGAQQETMYSGQGPGGPGKR
jgi:TP901 family phage tail tape measure protein